MDQIVRKGKIFYLLFSCNALHTGHVLKGPLTTSLKDEILWLRPAQIVQNRGLFPAILVLGSARKCLRYLFVQHLAERIHVDAEVSGIIVGERQNLQALAVRSRLRRFRSDPAKFPLN